MKSIKSYFYILLLLTGIISCDNNQQVDDFSNRKFVRIDVQTITISTGETYRITASFDSEETASMNFNWSILDTSKATIETNPDNSAIITGVSEGQTTIQVESENGELRYFSNLNVRSDYITKILIIGNEFSEDAVETYLYELANTAGKSVMIGNMYLSNASLAEHWENALNNNEIYEFRKIGTNGSMLREENATIYSAVKGENWDYIIFQEAGQLSGITNGYQQHLPNLINFVDELKTNPNLKIGVHQTWAYDRKSSQSGFDQYEYDQMKMYQSITEATSRAAQITGIDFVVPTGTAIQNGRTTYRKSRFTLSDSRLTSIIGKYTAASTWYEVIFGNVLQNNYIPQDLLEYDDALIKTSATKAVQQPYSVTILEDYLLPEQHNDFILEKPVFIDFGHVVAGGFYNHYGNPRDPKVTDLIDMDGVNTGFEIVVDYGFNNETLERGLNNIFGFPWEVCNDMFFADGIVEELKKSSFIVSNLNINRKYTFIFYCNINDTHTETEYQVIGENEGKAVLVTDYNDSNVAIVADIIPEGDASVVINLQPGPNNFQWAKFYGINAMIIAPEGYSFP